MFTGIIETLGTLTEIVKEEGNIHFGVTSSISTDLKLGQSVSHNGICLTVTKVSGQTHWVTVVAETLLKSNLHLLNVEEQINLERSMPIDGRFDGHIVQGHVDQVGHCVAINKNNGSWLVDFVYDSSTPHRTIEKGSIAINGVSLTCFNSCQGQFTVAIIPHTFEHTTFQTLKVNAVVNLEFDILGKYIQQLIGQNRADKIGG